MNSYKFISDEDLAQVMKPKLEELMAFVVPRVVVESTPIAGKESTPHHRGKPTEKTAALKEEEKEFLVSVLDQPNLTVTQRAKTLGHSSYMNDRLKKNLLAEGLVEELSINFGSATSGIVKFLELTAKGYQVLGKSVPKARPSGMSAEHWWWQRNVCEFYRKQGFHTEIEMSLNGKRADVGFVKDGLKVAVECGMSPKNEVSNVKKDLAAGFDKVLIATKNSRVKNAVEEQLGEFFTAEERQRVTVILLSDFSFVKEILGK